MNIFIRIMIFMIFLTAAGCDSSTNPDVLSIRLNGVELTNKTSVPMSAVDLNSNEVCADIPESGDDTYYFMLRLNTPDNTIIGNVNMYIGDGNNSTLSRCFNFSVIELTAQNFYSIHEANGYNVQVLATEESYKPEGLPEYLLQLNVDDKSFRLSNSPYIIPLVETYEGIDIYSNSTYPENVVSLKQVFDDVNPGMLAELMYVIIYNRDDPLHSDSLGGSASTHSFKVLESGHQISFKGIVYHELAHVHTVYNMEEECRLNEDCPILELDPGDDPRFAYNYSQYYDYEKLIGGYPSAYSIKRPNEYISELSRFVYLVYLYNEQINVEHLSPNMLTNINLLADRNYFLPEWIDNITAPLSVLPETSDFRIFSSDFPLSEYAETPEAIVQGRIAINGTTVYQDGEQVSATVTVGDPLELCFDITELTPETEFYNHQFLVRFNDEWYISISGAQLQETNGMYCRDFSVESMDLETELNVIELGLIKIAYLPNAGGIEGGSDSILIDAVIQ